MYEASFGLKRRPFAATPDASCFLSSDPIRAALDEVVVCVEQGQGIAVLTAPAGTGKTLLCERLRCELDERYETVFLRHSSFLTRRALLQTILCELNSPYHHPSEQELRLELLPAIRALQPKREALVLICDEAHQLSDSLLEELRILADFAEAGRPLVRLVLVGQLSLEEKLAQPGLDAFNQRIRAHVSLSSFDHTGSLDYIDYRLTWAGGRTDETFTPQALELIAKVSDGIPRCINQLADHTLLLAFVAEQKPAGEQLVREALSDLRQLPLHWNEPPQSLSSHDSSSNDVGDHFPDESPTEYLESTDSFDDLMTRSTFSFNLDPKPEGHDQSDELSTDSVTSTSPLTSYEHAAYENATSQQISLADLSIDDWRNTLELFDSSHSNHEYASSYTQQLTKPVVNPDEFVRFKDTNQIPFQELVHETVLSTVNSSITEPDGSDLINHEIVDELASVQTLLKLQSVESTAEVLSIQPAVFDRPNEQDAASEFDEEIIVDRYAAIDAGLEPPASSPLDTSNQVEVHPKQLLFGHSSLLGTPIGSVSDLRVEQSDSKDQILPSRDKQGPVWEGTFSLYANGPVPTVASSQKNAVESTVVDVETKAANPVATQFGDLSSESLIHAIRQEVDHLASSIGRKSDAISEIDSHEVSWDSVETPQPKLKSETRPFQYLFSKLRRKQQGLS